MGIEILPAVAVLVSPQNQVLRIQKDFTVYVFPSRRLLKTGVLREAVNQLRRSADAGATP